MLKLVLSYILNKQCKRKEKGVTDLKGTLVSNNVEYNLLRVYIPSTIVCALYNTRRQFGGEITFYLFIPTLWCVLFSLSLC